MNSNRIELININSKAKNKIFNWIQDSELKKMLGIRNQVSKRLHRKWMNKKIRDKNNITLLIKFSLNNQIFGVIGTMNTDVVSKTTYIYLYIGENDYKGKGYGKEALKLLLKFLFNSYEMRKVYANIYEYNKRSIKLFENVGFKKEATLDKHWYLGNDYYNMHIYSLMGEDYV